MDYTLQRVHVQTENNDPSLARAEFKANIEAIDKISDTGAVSSVVKSNIDGDINISGKGNFIGAVIGKALEVDISSSKTLSVSECKSTILNNFGQGANDCVTQLPTAEAGLNMLVLVGTSQAGNNLKVKAGTNDKIYLQGVAGVDGQSIITNPTIGSYLTLFTFKTGAISWDWIAVPGAGEWTAGV